VPPPPPPLLIRSEMRILLRASARNKRNAYKYIVKPLRTATQIFVDAETL
jgi:hypothetical protein